MSADRFRVDPAILPLLPPDVRADFDDDGFAVAAAPDRFNISPPFVPLPLEGPVSFEQSRRPEA